MRIRHFIDYRFDEETGEFQPIGIWMHNPVDGDVDIYYPDESCSECEEAMWVINRLVEADLKTPSDFLEFHQQRAGYLGMRSTIVEGETVLAYGEYGEQALRAVIERKSNEH